MKFYQALAVEEETPALWLAVHPLRWNTAEWGEPAIMFREVDDETQALADAAPDLLAALKELIGLVKAVREGEYEIDYYTTQPGLKAIAKATTDTDD